MELLKLLGIVIVIAGFALKLDSILVILAAAVVTAIVGGLGPVTLLETLGSTFVANRSMAIFIIVMLVTGTLERNGLREAAAALIGKFKSLIEANGTIDSVDDWGKRRLAYPIEDETEGVYTVIKFTSEPDFPAELDRNYRITEGVLRSIIVAEEA